MLLATWLDILLSQLTITGRHWNVCYTIWEALWNVVYSTNRRSQVIELVSLTTNRARDINDRKSTSGYMFQITGGAVTWKSKKESCVVLSTAEAEYIALSSAAQESVWLRQFTSELGCPTKGQITIFEDNQSALSKNPKFHGCAKNIDIKQHYIWEQVNSGTIKPKYCPTAPNIFTKGLSREQFCRLGNKVGTMLMNLPVEH